ncbi:MULTISPECIES: hypothetical protein [Aerosakkonema]|uniref:hypothetical protein n=1 Tax=Aerosakkonema TaxID=1246629 RepID=UPI0035B93A2B
MVYIFIAYLSAEDCIFTDYAKAGRPVQNNYIVTSGKLPFTFCLRSPVILSMLLDRDLMSWVSYFNPSYKDDGKASQND